MKKAIFLLFLLQLPFSTFAQNNYIGTDPFLPLFGTVSVNYERAILPRMSLSLNVGRKFGSGILTISGVDGDKLTTDDISFEGVRLLPEFRWYLSKENKGLTGFYTGLYYKYQTNNTQIASTFTPENGDPADVDIDLKIITNSVGLEIGYKLIILEKFYADFLIAGIGIAQSKLEVEAESEVPEGYFRELSGEVKRYFLLKGFKPDVLSQDRKLEADFALPSLRYGLRLGVRF